MGKYLGNRKPNYDKTPAVIIERENKSLILGWNDIVENLKADLAKVEKSNQVLVLDTYQGVYDEEIIGAVKGIEHSLFINAADLMMSAEEVDTLVYPDVTDDAIFGYLTRLKIEKFFNEEKIAEAKAQIAAAEGTVIVYGIGAALACDTPDLLVYADMARWEIQMRMRKDEVNNFGVENNELKFALQYKRSFFVDWRVIDRHKKTLMNKWDYVLDTNKAEEPKMLSGDVLASGMQKAVETPFRLVPFFDPGPWGGQWMKEVVDLDKDSENYAWCFDCVPEENSLCFQFGEHQFEIPSINLVFDKPAELMGAKVHGRFGDEFPIRFDFLDTMGGGNLSLQVHPLTEYIQQEFGMHYTQDESYYMLEAEEGANVYLGLKEGVNPQEMLNDLNHAQETGEEFPAEKHAGMFPAKKHDHFLIPAGTVHCSGAGSMVLEISATPYIFTFKLYDWGRMGLDGKPRPINIKHGEKVIDWNRTENWTKEHLVNAITPIAKGDGWEEEKTGLHEREFIETRRHWFTKEVLHKRTGSVDVINLVEGREAIIESPTGKFEPFVVHYAETFVLPVEAGDYTIRPYGEAEGTKCGTLKAFVRTEA
ncbi:MAG: class I mannose-6-phosphate isomerase [Bacteroidota bacterium]